MSLNSNNNNIYSSYPQAFFGLKWFCFEWCFIWIGKITIGIRWNQKLQWPLKWLGNGRRNDGTVDISERNDFEDIDGDSEKEDFGGREWCWFGDEWVPSQNKSDIFDEYEDPPYEKAENIVRTTEAKL